MKLMKQILKFALAGVVAIIRFAGVVLVGTLQGVTRAAGEVDDNNTYHKLTDTDYYGSK